MPSKKSDDLDNDVLLELIVEIQRIVEKRHGPQLDAARVIEYTFHAALAMIDAVTSHESNEERVKSLRSAAAFFVEITENDYIKTIEVPKEKRK
jgi:hypothetical protein